MANQISITAQSPFFDDFDATKDYIQVLFRPGYPVQARELTTLQTFLQEQIRRNGDNLYRDGSVIQRAELAVTEDAYELVLSGSGNSQFPITQAINTATLSPIDQLVGKVISNQAKTVQARVLPSPLGINTTSQVGNIYIKYITSEQFDSDGGFIYAFPEDNPGQISSITFYNTFSDSRKATVAAVDGGTFYVRGRFVQIQAQSVVVASGTQVANANIGFNFAEEAVTQNQDATLFDNARGSTNEGAPGAHRLKYSLTLVTKELTDTTDTNFYRLATYINGVRQEIADIGEEYKRLNEMLARRTFDESGNYAVRPFDVTVDEGDSDANFLLQVEPSKAYVKGFEITKTSPTKIYLERESGTKQTKNNILPVVGTTALVVTSVSGNLPGSTSGQPFLPSNRLQLKNSSNQVIGVARGWAVNDEFKKGEALTELYLFDIRMFTVLGTTSAFAAAVQTGNDVYSGKTRGYIYKEEGAAGVTNGVAVVSSTGNFRAGSTITSDVQNTSATVTSVSSFQLSQVTSITASNGFSATVDTTKVIENSNQSLFVETDKSIKTLKDATTNIIDNDFTVLENTNGNAVNLNAANGYFDSARVDDGVEIEKKLKFAYMKISNTTGNNYGWSATHREVSLFYPDIYKVFQVNESSDASFANGRFPRINVTTAGVLPQGAILTGRSSGTKAIVVLQNQSSVGETALGSHRYQIGSGSSSQVEIMYQKGTAFQSNEILDVEVTGVGTSYNYDVTFISSIAEVGTNVTGSFLLDDGQRKEFYDVGRLVRKDNVPAPSQDLIVFFSYFEADPSVAHFYTADSYSNEPLYSIDPRYFGEVREIKPFNGETGAQLRNGFDFRLRVKTTTSTSVSPFNFNTREFENQARILPDTTFTSDIIEFLGRTDLIELQKDGAFKIVQGVASKSPEKPKPSFDAMPLFFVNINPLVRYPDFDVTVSKVDNRRYTMRDIGELEMRINKVEENLELTMLELMALNDDVDTRTKSGFVVANFTKEKGEGVGDAEHPEFNATIDIINRRLIPAQTDGLPVPMDINASINIDNTFFPGYMLRSFSEEAFSTQLNATSGQRINPFATWTFEGDIEMTPNEDHWRIRKDNYFTSLFGDLQPFVGDSDAFQNFNQITTASPGGSSTTLVEWVGTPKTTRTSSRPHTVDDGRGVLRQRNVERTTQARRTTTTTKFDKPRSTGEVTSTLSDSQLVRNLGDYYMRPLTVSFTAKNLKPATQHDLKFGTIKLGTVTTDSEGSVSGRFNIPGETFKAGTQTMSLVDSNSGVSSFGFSQFKSIGHLDTFNTVANTIDEVVTRSTSNAEQSSRTWFTDPVAQMFMLPTVSLDERQPSIITSIDLWFNFVDTRPQMDRVKVEIRETLNGFPGGPDKIIGESAYMKVSKSNEVTAITDATAFNIKFKAPIVLRGGVEYAIVVKSPSELMELFVADMGQNLIDGSGIHSSQPNVGGYFGSFFVSQNSSTWSPEQSKDMTYRLYRANFSSGTSTVSLINKIQDTGTFKGDIGAFNQGLAMETFLNSNYVRVFHPNHGLHYSGARVTISGVTAGRTFNGIADSELNGTHDVWYPTLDTYCIKTTNFATGNGRINTGTFTTFATQDIVYDSIMTNFMETKEEGDNITVSMTPTQTNSMNLVVGTNNKISNNSIGTPVKSSTETVESNVLVEFENPMVVRSATNTNGVDLTIDLTLESGSQYTSPIMKTNNNLYPVVFRNIVGNSLTDSDIEGLTTTSASTTNDDTTQEFISYVQAIQSEAEHSSWITKEIELEIPADGFTVRFDADMEPTSSVIASYKVRAIGDDTPYEDLEWIDFPYDQQVTESNYGSFGSEAKEETYTLRAESNKDFTSFKLRLRMITENEAQVPRISNLRIIADV